MRIDRPLCVLCSVLCAVSCCGAAGVHEKDMFILIADHAIEAISVVHEFTRDESALEKTLQGVLPCVAARGVGCSLLALFAQACAGAPQSQVTTTSAKP